MRLTRLASLHRLGPDVSLLVNALSGAVDLVDDTMRAKLVELGCGARPALNEQDRESLEARGYLFASEGEERAAFHKVHEAYRRLASSRPVQFVVCPTYTCNLKCTYCFQSPNLRAQPHVMSSDQVEHLFGALDQIAARQPEREHQLVLFGGEPLLPITICVVEEILNRAGEKGLTVQMVTNGFYLSRFAPLLRRHRQVLRGAQITLDGPKPVHDTRRKAVQGQGSFDEVVAGVETCFDCGLAVNLRVNLDSQNIGHLEELVDLIEERAWTQREGFRCQLAPVTDHLGTSDYPFLMREDELVEPVFELWRRRPDLRDRLDFQLFRVLHHLITVMAPESKMRSLPRFHYCEADRGDALTFGPEGLIYICPESAGTPEHAIGTYSPHYRLHRRHLRQWENRSVLTLPECQECNIATFCGGGCGYAALRQFGSPAHGVCAGTPEVFDAYVRVLRRRFEQGEPFLPH